LIAENEKCQNKIDGNENIHYPGEDVPSPPFIADKRFPDMRVKIDRPRLHIASFSGTNLPIVLLKNNFCNSF